VKKIATQQEEKRSSRQDVIIKLPPKCHFTPTNIHIRKSKELAIFATDKRTRFSSYCYVPVEPCPDSSDKIDNAQKKQSQTNRETHQGYVVGV